MHTSTVVTSLSEDTLKQATATFCHVPSYSSITLIQQFVIEHYKIPTAQKAHDLVDYTVVQWMTLLLSIQKALAAVSCYFLSPSSYAPGQLNQ
jgi:hypothetical protein